MIESTRTPWMPRGERFERFDTELNSYWYSYVLDELKPKTPWYADRVWFTAEVAGGKVEFLGPREVDSMSTTISGISSMWERDRKVEPQV